MVPWSWVDFALLLLILICNLVRQHIVAPELRALPLWKKHHFPTGVLLLPTFLTAIYCFGQLNFQLNILPYYFLTFSLLIGTVLYEYVKQVAHFTIGNFIRYAFPSVFWYSFGYLMVLFFIRFLV